MSIPGWYPDPEQPSRERYWDGTRWSDRFRSPATARRRFPVVPVIVIGVVLVLIVVGVGWLTGGAEPTDRPRRDPAGGRPTREPCPRRDTSSPLPQPSDGRVHAGPLSFPQLPGPWEAPRYEPRMPYGQGAIHQRIVTDTSPSWMAEIGVATLSAGDGYFEPQEGAERILACLTASVFLGHPMDFHPRSAGPITVSGQPGYRIDVTATFDIPDLNTTSEQTTIIVVSNGRESAGFLGSVPDSHPHYRAGVETAVAGLQMQP
ncbi:DUF2510 domain-containing protein [Granulicoccus phenolivorans]|uniref:DUF2510 domain-containing protein n=1 Tax=Granulicoccus phenolivorans TaxID=266854 RepID=UPI000428962E|nr:DUF2510 domain-containing protein [Granulicoccus phenolivorans]